MRGQRAGAGTPRYIRDEDVRVRALRSLERMFELTRSKKGDRAKPLPVAAAESEARHA